jgi:hypothetical protein
MQTKSQITPESHMYALLDQSVAAASEDADGTLSLTFEGGQTLHIHESDKQFEAYCIVHCGVDIVRV